MRHTTIAMKSILTSIASCLITTLVSQPTSSGWATTIAGTDYDIAADVKTDVHGNIYTIGSFSGTTDFDGSALTNNKTSEGNTDIFITKHSSDGQLIWVTTFGGNNEDLGFGLDIQDSGEVYAVGTYKGLATFHSESPDGTLGSAGQEDMFIVKLDSNGVVQWVYRIGGNSVDEAKDIAVDHDNNLYIVGRFVGTVDFNPGTATSNLQAGGAPDGFILKLNSAGEYLWAYDIGSSGNDLAEAVVVDGQNNVITVGTFSGLTDFDPGPDEHNVSDGAGSVAPFHLKLTPAGAFVWVNTFTGTGYAYVGDVDVDNENNIVTHGFFTNSINPDPGGNPGSSIPTAGAEDSYTAKIYENGNVAWLNTIGGESLEFGYGVAVDALGDVYVTGFYWENPDFDPGDEEFLLPSVGIEDAYIVKYNRHGQLAWVKRAASPAGDAGYGIDINSSGDILVAGSYWGDIDLDPEPEGTLIIESKGSADVFIIQIDQMITSTTDHLALTANWKISPNPSTGALAIHGVEQYPVTITLFDMMGSRLFDPFILHSPGQLTDLQYLLSGIYYINIQSAHANVILKWIKI